MNYKKRKEELEKQFTQIVQEITQLQTFREQIRGQFKLLEELEKESKTEQGSKKQ